MARRLSRQKTIDYKQWASAPGLITEISTNVSQPSGSLGFSVPGTILRWRSYWSCMFDQTMQIGDLMVLTYGIALVSTDAVTAGALPDPAGEPEYPWVYWEEMRLDAFVAGGSLTNNSWGPSAQRYEVDSKAMRKFKPGQSIVAIVQSTDASGAPVTLLDIGQLRVLIGT